MFKFHLVVALMFAVAMPVCAQTQALKTLRYIILLDNGVVAGEQIVERPGLDMIKVHFDFKENGRGPTLDEVIKLGPDLTMLDYKVTGSSEMGGAVDERFTRKGGLAEWSVKAERGAKRLRGPAFYVPVDSSLEVTSLMISALSATRTGTLRLLPEGTLTQQRLDEAVVTRGTESEVVQLVMHTGLGLSPQFFWATTTAEHHLFAAIMPGNSAMIKEGWEANLID